jgi:hypothetical protein
MENHIVPLAPLAEGGLDQRLPFSGTQMFENP